MAYICMSAQNAARPAHGEQPACGPWTLMRVRPPLSVPISGEYSWVARAGVLSQNEIRR